MDTNKVTRVELKGSILNNISNAFYINLLRVELDNIITSTFDTVFSQKWVPVSGHYYAPQVELFVEKANSYPNYKYSCSSIFDIPTREMSLDEVTNLFKINKADCPITDAIKASDSSVTISTGCDDDSLDDDSFDYKENKYTYRPIEDYNLDYKENKYTYKPIHFIQFNYGCLEFENGEINSWCGNGCIKIATAECSKSYFKQLVLSRKIRLEGITYKAINKIIDFFIEKNISINNYIEKNLAIF